MHHHRHRARQWGALALIAASMTTASACAPEQGASPSTAAQSATETAVVASQPAATETAAAASQDPVLAFGRFRTHEAIPAPSPEEAHVIALILDKVGTFDVRQPDGSDYDQVLGIIPAGTTFEVSATIDQPSSALVGPDMTELTEVPEGVVSETSAHLELTKAEYTGATLTAQGEEASSSSVMIVSTLVLTQDTPVYEIAPFSLSYQMQKLTTTQPDAAQAAVSSLARVVGVGTPEDEMGFTTVSLGEGGEADADVYVREEDASIQHVVLLDEMSAY